MSSGADWPPSRFPPASIHACRARPKSRRRAPAGFREIKHDGFRILAHRRGPGLRIFSRNGHNFADRFPLIAEAIEALPVRSCVIDGEAIVCDDSGLAVFNLIRGHGTNARAVLCAFDLLRSTARTSGTLYSKIEQATTSIWHTCSNGMTSRERSPSSRPSSRRWRCRSVAILASSRRRGTQMVGDLPHWPPTSAGHIQCLEPASIGGVRSIPVSTYLDEHKVSVWRSLMSPAPAKAA